MSEHRDYYQEAWENTFKQNDRMDTVMFILLKRPKMTISEAMDMVDDPEFLEALLKEDEEE